MTLLKYIFVSILAFMFYYTDAQIKVSNSNLSSVCIQCDSLYNEICPSKPIVFGGPEVVAQFHGGDEVLLTFLKDNIKYPSECKEQGIQGRVIVQFIINEIGKISCPRICRSLHPAADEEAIRVVQLMPDWKPASNNGIPCKMCYTLPILFKL